MSVYIKDMEMPRTCYDCRFRKRDGLYLVCPILNKRFRIADTNVLFFREEDCPLISVPPHGDLIERDKLRTKEFIHDGDAYAVVMSKDVAQAPTIIPATEGEI